MTGRAKRRRFDGDERVDELKRERDYAREALRIKFREHKRNQCIDDPNCADCNLLAPPLNGKRPVDPWQQPA